MNEVMIKQIKAALKEDIPTVDVSSHYLFENEMSFGVFYAKEDGVISGIDVCKKTFELIDSTVEFKVLKANGSLVSVGDKIATVEGKTASILQAERVGLNFLQRMSGIATMANRFVAKTKGYQTKILDTRKTTPTLRIFEKQAVRDGGATNHRMNLSEMVMLKDNHIKAKGSITNAVKTVREAVGNAMLIEVEVETLEGFLEALKTSCNIIMLDNMSNDLMKQCVSLNQTNKTLEASGNMTIDRIASVCETGVDTISVGALTHSYRSLDISLKF